jgi:hypothetical protein
MRKIRRMEISRNFERNLAVGLAILMALSSILVSHVAATDGGLNLPPTPVRIEVSNGTESYFDTKLTDVPLGYDVTNGTYLGWCVDVRTEMARSPATHTVILYSSSNPPGELASEKWDVVNYVLNHKQGTARDIQQAIWYFIHMDGSYSPTSAVAWAIVNDTLENGSGFVPGEGQMIAVICYPTILFPSQPDVQISIIEVANIVIPEFPSVLILPLIMLTTLLPVIIYKKKEARFESKPRVVVRTTTQSHT